jgi:hypothetical protein
MRTLGAMVTALSLGACAAQPPTLSDMAAQIRSDFGAGRQSCADRSPAGPGQNHLAQAKCSAANPVAQSKASAQTAESRTKQRIVDVHPPVFNAPRQAAPPKPASAHETIAAVAGVPTLNSEASCHLADNLAVDQNVTRCLTLESSAHDELAHKWLEFAGADRSHCMRYTATGGGGTYTDLLTCLEMELHVRDLQTKTRSVANQ